MLCIVTAMFCKMAAKYGRCDSLYVFETVFCYITDPQNLYFDTGIMTVGNIINFKDMHIYMHGR